MMNKKEIIGLTKAEEQVMQILWRIEKGVVKDVLSQLPKPQPAYNTVSTIIRILESKGFVGYKAYGKTHEYFPLLKKEDYTRQEVSSLVKDYFEGSFEKMLSFFVKEKNISVKELDELMNLVEEIKNNKK